MNLNAICKAVIRCTVYLSRLKCIVQEYDFNSEILSDMLKSIQFFWQVLFALPVWSAAYKQAGAQNPEWLGVSQVRLGLCLFVSSDLRMA